MRSITYLACLFLLFCGYPDKLRSQNLQEFEDGQVALEFTTDVVLYEFDMYGDSIVDSSKVIAKYGQLFYLIPGKKSDSTPISKRGLGEFYIIKFARPLDSYDITQEVQNGKVKVTVNGRVNNEEESYLKYFTGQYIYGAKTKGRDSTPSLYRKYFCLKSSDLNEATIRKRFSTWKPMLSVGALAIPVKIRPGIKRSGTTPVPFDFSTDFTLGSTAGIRYRMSPYARNYLNFLIGFGVTSVLADSSSSRGVVPNSNTKLAAFTMTGGVLIEFSGFQAGAFIGSDFVGRAISLQGRSAWDYQGKPWIAIGMGYQIISRDGEDRATAK